jgi:hypothetical protein
MILHDQFLEINFVFHEYNTFFQQDALFLRRAKPVILNRKVRDQSTHRMRHQGNLLQTQTGRWRAVFNVMTVWAGNLLDLHCQQCRVIRNANQVLLLWVLYGKLVAAKFLCPEFFHILGKLQIFSIVFVVAENPERLVQRSLFHAGR